MIMLLVGLLEKMRLSCLLLAPEDLMAQPWVMISIAIQLVLSFSALPTTSRVESSAI